MKTFLTVQLALIPFTVFWALLGAHHPDWAIRSGFLLSLAFNGWRLWRHGIVMLEAGGLVLFGWLAALQLAMPDWTAANAPWLSFAGLGAASLFSVLIGHPWTADYSRAAYPDAAGTPQFRAVNAGISLVWGVLFLAIAACRAFDVSSLVTTAIVGLGALVSIFGPRLAIRYTLQRLRAARETFDWPAPSFAAAKDKDMATDCDVAVVGAGIGGLTAAALLADAGLRVNVFEQHVVAGGFCHTYLRKAHHDNEPVVYRFDAGPHDFSGLGPGGTISCMMRRLGIDAKLKWQRVRHSYYLSGKRIDVPDDWRDHVELLCEQFPASASGIRNLFQTIHAIFEGMFSTGRDRSGIPGMPQTVEATLAFPKDHPQAVRWMARPFDELVAQHVSDPDLIRLINALAGYLGDGGERLSCAQMVPIFGYYFEGGYYPLGGSGAFAEAFVEAIEQRGGEVHLKTRVDRILIEQGHATGLMLGDGRTIRADAVVCNADLKRTFLELVEPHQLPTEFRRRIEAAEPANSAFSVHLGLDFDPDIRPAIHVDRPIGIGLAMMSKLDPSAAPAGHSTLMLISLVPHAMAQGWFPPAGAEDWKDWRRSETYEARKQTLGDAMIAAAETVIPNLKQHIVYRTDASPVTYARYDWASAGAIYGISKAARLHGSKSPVRNLVVAGAGNAGAGVEAVVISGAEAAEALVPGLLARTRSDGLRQGARAPAGNLRRQSAA